MTWAMTEKGIRSVVPAVWWASTRESIAINPAVRTTPGYEGDCASCRRNVAGLAIAGCTSCLSGRAGK